MKKLYSSIAVMLIFAASHSQSGYSYEIINNENVRKQFGPITSDNDGNTIISGQFETTIALGGTTLTNTVPSWGYNAAFVAKVLPGGGFAWAKAFYPLTIPNGISSITVNGINTDAAGSIYVTGGVVGKIGFGVPNVSLSSTKNGNVYTRDIFTLKISVAGTVLWARAAGTANDGCNAGEFGTSVTTDNAGNVYATGQIVWKVFKNTNVCNELGGPDCGNASSKSITCPYVVKYSAAGNIIWERKYVNNGALASTSCWYNHPQGTNVRTDGTDIYVNGYFYGTVDFGTGPLSTGSETTGNSFLIKLTGNGTTLWSRSVTGGANNPFGVGDDLFVDGNDIYISGIYSGNISFGACSLPSFSPPDFFAKYSSSGACQWAINTRGISYGVVRHPNGNLAMLRRGRFYSIREFSPLDGSLIDSTVTPLADTATASIWGYPSFAQLPEGFIFSHHIQGTLHFGDLTITSTGSADNMMLIRYTATPPPVVRRGNIISETSPNKIVLYPNPTSNQITIQNNNNKLLGTVSIYDISGKMIYKNFVGSFQTTIDVKNFSAGVYYIKSDQLQVTINFVKQ